MRIKPFNCKKLMAVLFCDEFNGCRDLTLKTLTHRNICIKFFSLSEPNIGLFIQLLIVNDKPKKKRS